MPRVVVFRKRSFILKPAETDDVFSLVSRIVWSMLINETHTHTQSPRSSRGEGFAQLLFWKAILAGLVKIGGTSGPRIGAGVDLQEGGQSSGDHGTNWLISRDTIPTYLTKSGVHEPCGMTFSTCRWRTLASIPRALSLGRSSLSGVFLLCFFNLDARRHEHGTGLVSGGSGQVYF